MPKILYKLASRERKNRLFATIDNILAMVRHYDFEILCSFDNNDDTYNNPEFLTQLNRYPKVIYRFGDNTSKVMAINANIDAVPNFDILVTESDDQLWTHEGFDLEIIKAFETYFPDFDGLVHFPDQIAGERLVTKSIVGKKYYERFGHTYFPDYESVCCDNDQMEIAIILKRYVFINKVMFNHNHVVWKLSEWDDLYRRNESPMHYVKDGELLKERRKNNFGLNP